MPVALASRLIRDVWCVWQFFGVALRVGAADVCCMHYVVLVILDADSRYSRFECAHDDAAAVMGTRNEHITLQSASRARLSPDSRCNGDGVLAHVLGGR